MKKRILAALAAVAMVLSVCTIASAGTMEDALKYSQDFESGISGWVDANNVTLVADPFDAENQVLKVSGDWASFVSEDLAGVSTQGKTYTIVFRVYGDCGFFGLTQDQAFFQKQKAICGAAGEVYTEVVNDKWHTYVYTYENTWGRTRLCGQVQSVPKLSDVFYVDDVKIYEGDFYDDIVATLPTPEPVSEETKAPEATATPEVTDGATQAPEATTAAPATTTAPVVAGTPSATVAPSASATVDTGKTDDNGTTAKKSIKFKKKKVTIKKGKKATLKVTIKGAKKAKFSVNKKGKKIVKLSKKKAKSVVVTGKKKGKATITAKAAGKKATCKVTVK